MSLLNIQRMQLVWVGLGLAYNGISLWQINLGNTSLSPTDPVAGSVFVVICGLLILAGIKGAHRLYKLTIPVLGLFLIYSGVGLHVMEFLNDATLLGYASFTSWFAAIIVNTYGSITLLMGSWLALRSKAT